MALLEILHYPDKRLRTVAAPVDAVDDSIRSLVDDMFETMYAAPGIGLAATQVDVHKRVIVMDLSAEKNEPVCLINPEIVSSEGVEQTEEGCLSVPDIFETVERAERVEVKALDRDGNEFTLEADGLLAVFVVSLHQHVVDRVGVTQQVAVSVREAKANHVAVAAVGLGDEGEGVLPEGRNAAHRMPRPDGALTVEPGARPHRCDRPHPANGARRRSAMSAAPASPAGGG